MLFGIAVADAACPNPNLAGKAIPDPMLQTGYFALVFLTPILQKFVLLTPLVYASEGLRGVLTPQFPHMSLAAVIGALLVFDLALLFLGLKQFRSKAVS